MNRFTLTLASLALTTAANASITSNAGSTTFLGTPPLNAQQFNLTGATAYCWNEQTGVTSSATPVNITSNGIYSGPTPNFSIVSGTFDSHFIHFDPSPTPTAISGSVTFSGTIAAVIYDRTLLSLSDSVFGSGGTTYDTANPLRSMVGNAVGSNGLTVAGNTLFFQLGVFPGMVNRMAEIRVLTVSIPTPSSAALATLGGLITLRRRRRR